jgi:apolipoprotein N-acyltransferase
MFGAFVPLLFLLNEWHDKTKEGEKFKVLQYVYNTFIIWNIVSTYWVANTAFSAGIFAIVVNSLFMCVPVWLYLQAKKHTSPALSVLAFAAFWISFEYGHMRWDLTWPWLTLGNSWAPFPQAVQWYEFTGHLGGSLWILIMNYVLYKAISSFMKKDKKVLISHVILFLIIGLGPIIWSYIRYNSYEEKKDPIDVVVIQPNFEPHYQKFDVSEAQQLDQFLALSRNKLDDSADFLVFPETSLSSINHDRLYEYSEARTLKSFLDEYEDLKLVTGLSSFFTYEDGQVPDARWVRSHIGKNDTVYWAVANSAIYMQSNKDNYEVYLKSKLVPGAEIFPYRDFFFFMEPLVKKLGGSLYGWAVQPERTIFSNEKARIAPVICYESVFGEYVTEYIKKGADVIFIITNDGWWDNTPGHKQHLQFASLRAIETRRSIARSANTGISGFINQRGDILHATHYNEPAAVRGLMNRNDEITFYVRWGDLVGRISLFIAMITMIAIISALVRKKLNKEPDEHLQEA